VGHHLAVGVVAGDLGEDQFPAAADRAGVASRSQRLAAPTYWTVIPTVEARVPLLKSWFDQAAAAPAVSSTDAITPPWK
jgi:hypothetical protein